MAGATEVISSWLNKLKGTVVNNGSSALPDLTGKTLDDFYVLRKMDISSGEADIYLCSGTGRRAGKQYILKYYRRMNAVKPDVVRKLMGIKNPSVAPIEGFGVFQNHQYTVLPYYEMPALSQILAGGVKFSEEELRTRIIPSVIEGLRAVHEAGILHKDLKPGNLIPDSSGEHIVLIDFGISSDAGGNTFVVTQTGMTPFYAAPEALQGIFHRETDYYALGITIFELFTGFTPFQNPGISGEEAARLAAISKIEFPENFPERLKNLVLGLTYKDISHRNERNNPNRRWGYDEVKRWLQGENVPVPGESTGAEKVYPAAAPEFPPYRFNGITCRTENELIRALLANPEMGIRDLSRGLLTHHYFNFDERKGELCEKAERLIEHSNDKARDFVDFLFRLAPDSDAFGAAVFGNREYEFQNPEEFLSYIEGLSRDGSCYEILHLFKSYGRALKAMSLKAWPFSAYRRLEQLASPLIQFGDRIFRDDEAFKEYLENIIADYESAPLNLKNFFSERESILKKLKERPVLADVISRLEQFGVKEPESTVIDVNGINYPAADDIVVPGGIIKFGRYPRGDHGPEEPIEWLVLEVSGNEALLISRYCLGYSKYHHEWADIMTWENCDLRRWLNNDFLRVAFSREEFERLKVSKLRNDNNPRYGTPGGNRTEDRVFCLSFGEAEQYFQNDEERKCEAYTGEGLCSWWLRSPGIDQANASNVETNGMLNTVGLVISYGGYAVRPALRIILNR